MYTTALKVRSAEHISQICDGANVCASKACMGRGCSNRASEAVGQDATIDEHSSGIRPPLDISDAFLADVLKPYRPNARYLRSAQLTYFRDKTSFHTGGKDAGLVTGTGKFSIPSSCYIDDTGHFNAVEFNICYNQLAYVIFGKCLEADILKNLRLEKGNVSFTDFKRHQLSSMVIVSIESRYYKMLKTHDFQAVFTINRISASAGAYFCFTAISFSDAEGVKSKGTVLLAFDPSRTDTR